MASEQEEFEQLKEEYVTTFRQMNSLQQKVVTLEQQLAQARALLKEAADLIDGEGMAAPVADEIYTFLAEKEQSQ